MARRPLGMKGIEQNDRLKESLKKQGNALNDARVEHLQNSLDSFRTHLELFSRKHKEAIRADPKFRAQFALMCSQIGVDPLASNKGFWAELLGIGDYFFDLGVKVMTIAISTRSTNGGIIGVDELLERLEAQRLRTDAALARASKAKKQVKSSPKVSVEDISKAIEKISSLGSGLKLATIGIRKVLISVPLEFSQDQSLLLESTSSLKGSPISAEKVKSSLGWSSERASRACKDLAAEGLAWWDKVSDEYWFPAFVEGGVNFDS